MELFKNIIEYIVIFISGVILVYKTNYILTFYQQSHYHFSSFKKIIKHYYFGKKQFFIFGCLPFVFFLDNYVVGILYIFYITFLLILHFQNKNIIKLKITARIYRNYICILILGTIIASTLLLITNLPELSSALAIVLFFLPFLVLLSSFVVYPIEYLISLYYQKKAKKKLLKINPVVIGITGSFGKTTTKNFLFEFIKDNYITLQTKKSYNTLNGISLSINEDLTKEVEVFIVEMGASHVGDISKLCMLAKPKYAILTGVTYQHLETFKTIQNIINEKIKIIESLDENSLGVINGDDEFLKTVKINTKAKLIKFGFNETNDIYASDIKVDIEKMSFKINYKNKALLVTTNLVGKHNILNILASYAIANHLGIKDEEIVEKIASLTTPNNRLKIEKLGTHTIINDSFNSNNVGFVNALEVLGLYEGAKVLITPGIVEGGSLEFEINYSLAKHIVKYVDEVVLIDTKASRYIYDGLKEEGFNNVVLLNSFFEARDYVFEKYPKATILIENDISDIYKI